MDKRLSAAEVGLPIRRCFTAPALGIAALVLLAGCAQRVGAADQDRHDGFYGGASIGGGRRGGAGGDGGGGGMGGM